MKALYSLSLVLFMCLTFSCTPENEVTTFVELTELERAENYLDSSQSRILFGKANFANDGSWSDAWIINKWGQVREVDLDGFMHSGFSDIVFEEQLNDLNDSGTFLYEIEDKIMLADFHRKAELQVKGLKAEAGTAYFSFHLDRTGRISSTGGDCSGGGDDSAIVVFDMSILSMNENLANTPSAAQVVHWLQNVDNLLN